MTSGWTSITSRDLSGEDVPAPDRGGRREPAASEVPDLRLQGADNVGARGRAKALPKACPDSKWDWISAAACAGADPSFFFPEDRFNTRSQAGLADYYGAVSYTRMRFCNHCPAQEACLAHSLRVGEASGIWGGLGPIERGVLK